jgi:hypothetical protein
MRSKAIEVKNRGYIRKVVLALVCGCCSPSTISSSSLPSPERKVRISRRNTQLQCLCDKVLTFPIDEFREEELEQLEKRTVLESSNGEEELFTRLLHCKMPEGQLRLWGYPIPRALSDLAVNREQFGAQDDPPAKRPRIETTKSTEIEREVVGELLAQELLQLHRRNFPIDSVSADSKQQSAFNGTRNEAYRPILGFFETLSSQNLSVFASEFSNKFPEPLSMASLDCEMLDVRDANSPTGMRREVVRVTVLDAHQRTVLEAIIRPSGTIVTTVNGNQDCDLSCVLDFKERFTGITSSALRMLVLSQQAISQQQLLATLLTMVSKDTILVGHGLENDLQCLGIAHARVVDTAALFPHPRGFPYRMALKQLSRKYLNMEIQSNDNGKSHCSAEDSAAAWQLACLAANQRASGIFLSTNASSDILSGDVTLPAMEERVSLLKRIQAQMASIYSVPTLLCDVRGANDAVDTTADLHMNEVTNAEDEDGPGQIISSHPAVVDSVGAVTVPVSVRRDHHKIFATFEQLYDRENCDEVDDSVEYYRSSSISDSCSKLRTFVQQRDTSDSMIQSMRLAVVHISEGSGSVETIQAAIEEAVISNPATVGETVVLTMHQLSMQNALSLAHQRHRALYAQTYAARETTRNRTLTGVGETLRQLREPPVSWDANNEHEYQSAIQLLHSDVTITMRIK